MRKILFLHHYNSSVGAGLSFLHILQSIDRTENELLVCLPKIKGDLDKKIIEMGIRVIYSDAVVPYMHFSGSNMLFFSKRNLSNFLKISKAKAELKEVISNESPDCVAVNSLTLFWVGKIAKQLNKKAICFHRETYDHGLFGVRCEWMKKELSKYFDAIAFLSNYDLQSTPSGTGKYVRITDKVDVQAYESLTKNGCREKLGLPKDEKLVLYVGGVSALKGPLTAIKALKWVDNIKLVFLQYKPKSLNSFKERLKYIAKILMNKNLLYKIDRLVKKEKLQDRIIFRPATDKVEEYFVACDAVIFPSMQAHQSRPVYEAGIAKKPVAITDFENTQEFLDETNGWLFEKGNARILAEKIKEMFLDDASARCEENYKRAFATNNLERLPVEIRELFETVFMEAAK